jgi:hypothetical protein
MSIWSTKTLWSDVYELDNSFVQKLLFYIKINESLKSKKYFSFDCGYFVFQSIVTFLPFELTCSSSFAFLL